MNLQKLAQENKILKYEVGSRLFGTSTPTSDVDFSGVFVATEDFYLGLDTVEEVDCSVVDKLENGRNSQDAVDEKCYELRKFVGLALGNNPNIIEQLFVPLDQLHHVTEVGHELLANAHLFPHTGTYDKFIGYAVSQKKKMVIKRDNMNSILFALELISQYDLKKYIAELPIVCGINGVKDTGQHIMFGDCSVQKNDTVKQALRKLEDRKGKFSGRHEDFVSKYGYDTKFAAHLLRLLWEGGFLLKHGYLEFPLENRDLFLDVRSGKYTIEEVLEMATQLEDEMRGLKETSKLPKKPRKEEVNELLKRLVKMHWELNR